MITSSFFIFPGNFTHSCKIDAGNMWMDEDSQKERFIKQKTMERGRMNRNKN
jgi:hypothetical protein